MNPSWPNPFARNDLQTNPASPEHAGPVKAARTRSIKLNTKQRGRRQIDYPAMQSPSIVDISGAARFYEGEGNVSINRNQLKVCINQNDREVLDWLSCLFGGRV